MMIGNKYLLLILMAGSMIGLVVCSSTDKKASNLPVWETERCDTSVHHFGDFEVADIVSPFWAADTLKTNLTVVPTVYFLVIKEGSIQQIQHVTNGSFKELSFATDTTNWLSKTYLWTLADRPDYPYLRYVPLLQPIRKQFLEKRDSMMVQYKARFPQYSLKVQSDLRGRGNQLKHLTMGKSISPLSQHNFGLASDIGIWYKGKQLQNISHYKIFLGEIGSQYELTWGGTFLGFIDPNHIQYFKNSAEMLKKLPQLRLEFEPYLKYFKNRVARMTAAGKAAKVEDTKDLLTTLHQLHIGKTCVCDSLAERVVPTYGDLFHNKIPDYQSQKDIVLIADIDRQFAVLWHPSGVKKAFRIGKWQ